MHKRMIFAAVAALWLAGCAQEPPAGPERLDVYHQWRNVHQPWPVDLTAGEEAPASFSASFAGCTCEAMVIEEDARSGELHLIDCGSELRCPDFDGRSYELAITPEDLLTICSTATQGCGLFVKVNP